MREPFWARRGAPSVRHANLFKTVRWLTFGLAATAMLLTGAAVARADIRGIFVATYTTGHFNRPVIAQEGVDGLFIRLPWHVVNPSRDVFDFDRLDDLLEPVVRNGKKASVAIMAGVYTPSWVYNVAGARALGLRMVRDPVSDGERRIPIPWDQNYLWAHDRLMQGLSRFLRRRPNYDRAVVMVKMSGLVMGSAEMRLLHPRLSADRSIDWGGASGPDFESYKRALRLQQTLAWQDAGYKPSLVKHAAATMIDQVASHFPGKTVGLAVLVDPASFPPIAEGGRLIDPSMVRLSRRITVRNAERYRSRLSVNSTVLLAHKGTPLLVDLAYRRGAKIGYQVAEQHIGHPNCQGRGDTAPGRRDPCQPHRFRDALERGLSRGASFIEVFDHNAEAYPNILNDFSYRLNPNRF